MDKKKKRVHLYVATSVYTCASENGLSRQRRDFLFLLCSHVHSERSKGIVCTSLWVVCMISARGVIIVFVAAGADAHATDCIWYNVTRVTVLTGWVDCATEPLL